MYPSADQVVETLGAAADENRMAPARQEQVVHLPAEGELWMTGDLHDHRRNFDKLVKASDLGGAEESWIPLHRAAELKCDFPEQVHFLLANHDLAQIHGKGIMKAGLSVCEAFTKGVRKAFEGQHNLVTAAISEFLLSLPLAVKAENGIFCCHSLPTDDQIDTFDYSIFERPLVGADYAARTGPVYQLIWGRNMGPATVDKFAEQVGAALIINGHQPQESGYTVVGDRQLILASDHNQGVFLPMDLGQQYTMDDLVGML